MAKKGILNKVAADVKQAIMEAFSALGAVGYLKRVAITDPKTFCALLGKILPVQVAGEAENPLMLRVTVDRPPDETREQWLARTARERGHSPAVVGTTTGPTNGRDDG